MFYKEDWEKAQQRLMALWHQETIDRCCVAVTAPRKGCESFFQGTSPHGFYNAGAMITARNMDDPEAVLRQYEQIFQNTYYGGEAFPQIWMNFGPAGHAAYFGSRHHVAENTVWFDPVIEDWDQSDLVYDDQCQILNWQRDMARFLSQKGSGRFIVSTPDNSGSLDALASIRGTQEMLIDMALEPEYIEAACQKVMQGWNRAGQELFELTQEGNDGGSSIGWLAIWAKGRMSQLQSDVSVMLSEKMFEQFVMPELTWCADQQDYSLYHLDGQAQLRHLDQILSVKKIQMIQWVSVAGEPSYLTFIDAFKKIQASGKSLLINDVHAKDIPYLLEQLSSKGLLLMTSAATQDEAEEIIRLVEKQS